MVSSEKRKKTRRFNNKMQANLLLVFCIVVVLFCILVARLLQLNNKDGERYAKKVLSQQTYVSNAIPYRRGDIVDRNKTKLATSVAVYDLIISPKEILSEAKYKQPTMNALVQCFDVTAEELETILADKPNSQYKIVLKNLKAELVEKFKALEEEEKKASKTEKRKACIQGVWFEKKYKRQYPLNSTACSVVGFTTSDNVGLWGLEGQYNEELNGTVGREYGYFDSDSNLERTVKAASNGNTLVTTIDANIQSIVEKKINAFMKEIGAKNVSVLVMNPTNAEIYAMSSQNMYDLNNPFDLTPFYSKAKIEKMTEEEKSTILNRIWANYCISTSFEPGSTFKPITIAAGLEEGVVSDKSTFVCDGGHMVGGRRIRCVSNIGHGTLNLQGALMKSCNDVLMQVVEKLGKVQFENYQTNFNFGRKTGIDLPGETTGIVFSGDRLNVTELATSSFGQGLTVSMVQMGSAISSLVNGGYYYEPHVVKQVLNENGAVVKNIEPILIKETISRQTSELIRKYMLATVEEGTADTAKIEGYSIGGKTGTAEKFPRGNKKYLVSFIGCAPMDNPEVLVYVIVDEPDVKDQAHSTYAQGIAREIMEEIFPFLNIFPNNDVKQKDKDKTKSDNGGKKKEEEITPTVSPAPSDNTEEDESGSVFEDPNAVPPATAEPVPTIKVDIQEE